jgi:hypothetical protein
MQIQYRFVEVLFDGAYKLQIKIGDGEWDDADRITCDVCEMKLNDFKWEDVG